MQSSKLDDGFMSYTRHLKRLKKEEYKQLQSVVCDNQFAVSLNLSISQSEKEDGRSTVSERSKGTHVVKEYTSGRNKYHYKKELNCIIDERAVVVKGKLVFLHEEEDLHGKNYILLSVLRKHNIGNKQYIYGNKYQLLGAIRQKYAEKENYIIQKYVSKNINEENSSCIYITYWFSNAKDSIFTNE